MSDCLIIGSLSSCMHQHNLSNTLFSLHTVLTNCFHFCNSGEITLHVVMCESLLGVRPINIFMKDNGKWMNHLKMKHQRQSQRRKTTLRSPWTNVSHLQSADAFASTTIQRPQESLQGCAEGPTIEVLQQTTARVQSLCRLAYLRVPTASWSCWKDVRQVVAFTASSLLHSSHKAAQEQLQVEEVCNTALKSKDYR